MSPVNSQVIITEVAPRDGLQSEVQWVPSEIKQHFIHLLQEAGVPEIECTSFVSPKWVPQMADNQQLWLGIHKKPGVSYLALVPNVQGLHLAIESKVEEVVVFGSVSEAFSLKNINCTIDQSIDKFSKIVALAQLHNIRVRGILSCTLGCPYEGPIEARQVVKVAEKMKAIGINRLGLADTIGVGTPNAVITLLDQIATIYPVHSLSAHFHDTYGQALVNIYACLQAGVRRFDSSVSGLGGCPYAKGATGNVATEELVYMLHGLGYHTGINLEKLIMAGDFMRNYLKNTNNSRVALAYLAKRS
ncbi:MAG: hydroxymethylglutaryl-CoA lyase [Gammaproteobacteria bacterium]|nr:hydroxymethylglutaryl-CoA lyase [Gammaproteobacteria bacterium]